MTALEVYECLLAVRADGRDSRFGRRAELHASERPRVAKQWDRYNPKFYMWWTCKLYLHHMLRSRTLMTNPAELLGAQGLRGPFRGS